MPSFDLIAAAVSSRSRAASAQSLINLYPEVNDDGSLTLYGTPGKRLWATIGDGPVRGFIVVSTTLYAVSGTEVYSVDVSGTATLLGTISSGFGRVGLATNGIDVLIVDGVSGYRIASGALAEIADADFPAGVTWAAYLNGIYLVGGDGTQKFYGSALLDGSSWNALDFASAEGDPDALLMGMVTSSEFLPFGSRTLEFWSYTGAAGFPVERTGNAFVEQGIIAPWSAVKLDSSIFWLGRSAEGQGIVWRLNGYTPQRVSNHAIEYAIGQWSDMSDAYGWAYVQDGHAFYVLSSASGDITLVYDVASQRWHQRRWRDSSNMQHRDRIYSYVFFNGLHLGGDWEDGKVYVIDLDTYTDNGDTILREVTAPHMRSGKRRFYGEAEVYIESGVGLQAGQGSDPQIMLSYSDDGQVFKGESWRSFGAAGIYSRALWRRLGSSFNRTFRLRITDPVKVAITGARVEFTE